MPRTLTRARLSCHKAWRGYTLRSALDRAADMLKTAPPRSTAGKTDLWTSFVSTSFRQSSLESERELHPMLSVKLPDGSVREYSKRVRPVDVAGEIGPRLAK